MSLESIKKYFEPKSVLDIGANVGQFYNEIKFIFPNAYYYLVDGSESCEVVLETLNVDYSICLLSDYEKEVDFYIRKNEPRVDLVREIIAPSGRKVETSIAFGAEFFRPFF